MSTSTLLAAVQSLAELAKKLPPPKAQELRALAAAAGGLLILAFALVGMAWWTLRRVRRRMRGRLGASRSIHDAWYRKPAAGDSFSDLDEPRP
jgi:hypothetical protein